MLTIQHRSLTKINHVTRHTLVFERMERNAHSFQILTHYLRFFKIHASWERHSANVRSHLVYCHIYPFTEGARGSGRPRPTLNNVRSRTKQVSTSMPPAANVNMKQSLGVRINSFVPHMLRLWSVGCTRPHLMSRFQVLVYLCVRAYSDCAPQIGPYLF